MGNYPFMELKLTGKAFAFQRIHIRTYLLQPICWLFMAGIFVSSCVKSDLLDCSLAYIVIAPTDHSYNLPGLRYHFYSQDYRIANSVLPCDGTGTFRGRLMTGDYWVIASNIDAHNSIFTDMDAYETATVHVRQIKTRSDDYYLAYPGEIYAISLQKLAIGGRDTIYLSPKPELLTKTLSLKFKIGSNIEQQTIGLTGTLQGVYPSLNLFTRQPTEHCLSLSPNMITRFTSIGSADEWQAEISLLGICDPEYGTRYRNIMHFTLNTTGGDMPVAVELTNVLSDIIKKNGGTIPLEIPIEITVQYDGILLEAEARPWVDSGSGEGVIN